VGTIYISGVPDDIEEDVRFWANYYGKPHHAIIKVFHRMILARPWTAYIVPAGEMELLFREKLREMLKANPQLRAAVGENLPDGGRIPSLIELVSPEAIGERLGPLFASQIKELQLARKSRIQRVKDSVREFITADEEDEPEEDL
jgi:hypothetical protein